jgi:hypothetical protein
MMAIILLIEIPCDSNGVCNGLSAVRFAESMLPKPAAFKTSLYNSYKLDGPYPLENICGRWHVIGPRGAKRWPNTDPSQGRAAPTKVLVAF